MCKRLLFVCFTLMVLLTPDQVFAQFTEPHTYDNTPVGTNQLELAYAYAHANASIDTSLIVAGARFNLNQGAVTYTRYFGFVHRAAWVEASVPLADLSGSISGTNIHGSATGTGDSSYAVAALLVGGPALSVAQFADYKPTTTVGMSLTITAPTGEYNPNKLLNLGSDRWSISSGMTASRKKCSRRSRFRLQNRIQVRTPAVEIWEIVVSSTSAAINCSLIELIAVRGMVNFTTRVFGCRVRTSRAA